MPANKNEAVPNLPIAQVKMEAALATKNCDMGIIACHRRGTVFGHVLHGMKSGLVSQAIVSMRLAFILLPVMMFFSGINAVAQLVTLDTKNASVHEVISAVKKQTGYVFFYKKSVLKNAKKITLTVRGLPVKDFLSTAFKNQPFSWSVENKTITLAPLPPAPSAPIPEIKETPASPVTVILSVTDSTGNPLAGATVSVGQTEQMLATNQEGTVPIDLVEGDVLIISYVGRLSRTITISAAILSQKALAVKLVPRQSPLDDVIVIAYGLQRRSDITGSLSRITAETIQERPVTNLAQALQGKAAGLNVATNIKPGETPSIRIRGTRSANASNDPLYVVDGVPMVSALGVGSFSINDLNPNDIASVEILKDASATAVYGSRGANGVLLITTKKGVRGKVSLHYNASISFDSYHSMLDQMNAGQYIDMLRYALINGRRYQPENNSNLTEAPMQWYAHPALDSASFVASGITNNYAELLAATMKGYDWNADGSVKTRPTTEAEQAMGWPAMVPVYSASKIPTFDWLGAASRTGISHNHQIAVSAGSEVSRLYMSLGYTRQLGVQKDQDFTRYNININGEVSPVKWLTAGISLLSSLANQHFGINTNMSNTGAKDLYGRAAGQFPWAMPTDASGAFRRNPGGNLNLWNPLIDISQSINERRAVSAMSNIHAEVKFAPWLKYRINFGAQMRNTRSGAWRGPEATPHFAASANTAGYSRDEHFSWVVENLLYVDKAFGRKHALGLTLLQSSQHSRREGTATNVGGLVIPLSLWYDLASNTQGNPGIGTWFTENKLSSFMGRVNYSLKDKYLLTASGRFDGSSVLAPGHKWDFFPSFALAWKMQEESFMKNIGWLNELKPRFGFGVTGNSSVAPYTTTGPLSRNNYVFGTVPAIGFLPQTVQNPGLGWEKTAQSNVGIDFALFNHRVSGSVEYYVQNTSDLIFSRDLPAVSGFITKLMNVGGSSNRGMELTLGTCNIQTRNFSWATELTWSRNREEITGLINGKENMVASRLFIGQPWQVFYQLQDAGIWGTSSKELEEMARFKSVGGLDFRPGTVRVIDQNGDYKIDAADYVIRGTYRPKWYGGITNVFKYQNLTLSSFIYARIGHTYFGGTPGIFSRNENNLWNWESQTGKWPLPVLGASAITNITAAQQYHKGSFAVVRNISLSYDFAPRLMALAKMKSLQLNVQVLNPFIFGGELVKMGINPDDETNWEDQSTPNTFNTTPAGGMNNNTVLPRSIVFGLRAAF